MEVNKKRRDVSLDHALVLVGDFSWAQKLQASLCSLAWGVSAVQIVIVLLSILGATEPREYMACTKRDGEACAAALAEPAAIAMCGLPRHAWEWTVSRGFSLVTEFELICGRAWITPFPAICLFIGTLLGCVACDMMMERVSRRRILSTGLLLSGVAGCMAATAPFIWTLCACLAAMGAGIASIGISSYLLTTDVCGRSWRPYAGLFLHAGFSLGAVIGAIVVFLVPLWRWAMLIGALLPLLSTLSAWSLIMESPEWLLLNNRKGEATATLAALAFANRLQPLECPLSDPTAILANPHRNVEDIVQSPRLRRRMVLYSALWCMATLAYFTSAMLFDALGDHSGNEGDGSTLEIAIAGFAYELPGVAAAALIAERLGRRRTVFSGLLVAGLAFGSAGLAHANPMQRGLAACGRFGLALGFAGLLISTYEAFPVAVQRPGMAVAVYAGRIGAIISPILAFLAVPLSLPTLPLLLAAFLCGGACVISLMLPETLGMPICETVYDFNNQTVMKTRRHRFSWAHAWRRVRSGQPLWPQIQHQPNSQLVIVQAEGSSSAVEV